MASFAVLTMAISVPFVDVASADRRARFGSHT